MKRIDLDQVRMRAQCLVDGHAAHHMSVHELQDYLGSGLAYQLETWMMSEDLSPGPKRINIFKELDFHIDLKTSTPSNWWQHFKRDHMPAWFVDKYPVKHKEETHRRKVNRYVRSSGEIHFKVSAVYPKLPEVYPDCGIHVTTVERPNFSYKSFCEIIGINKRGFEDYCLQGGVSSELLIKMDYEEDKVRPNDK